MTLHRISFSRAVWTLLAVATAAVVAGCGGGTSAKPLADQSIAGQVKRLRDQIVSQEKIAQARPGSVQRAFLSYWRGVQFGDADRALTAYEDGLRDVVGTQLLALAIRNASDVYRAQTPTVEETDVRGDVATVRYFAKTQASGSLVVPLSISWRRSLGGWRIHYSSALDGELRNAAQSRAQFDLKPGAQIIDPRAVRAGERAAGLQAEYLARPGSPP